MPWLQRHEPAKPEGVVELTPEKINENVNAVKTDLEKKLTDLGESINNHPTLLAMKEFLDGQKSGEDERAAAAARAAEEARNRGFENLDPAARQYVDTQLQPIAKAALWQQGNEARRTIFEDQEAFPMYTGAIKAKVDEYLDKQSPEGRANPEVIRNVYKIVCHDNQAEINEGKHKSRLASAVNPGTGTGSQGTRDTNALPVLNAQEKQVARSMGMKEEEYAAAKKELEESGEYV